MCGFSALDFYLQSTCQLFVYCLYSSLSHKLARAELGILIVLSLYLAQFWFIVGIQWKQWINVNLHITSSKLQKSVS